MLNLNPGGALRWCCLLLFICVSVCLAADKSVAADENKQNEEAGTVSVRLRPSHPHCGLYCIYTAMKLAGKEVDFKELVKPEYLGSRKGSSLAELKQAAEGNGLYATSVSKMTTLILRQCPYQTILHVKSDMTSKEYDHYELFLGTENGKAKLFNPPEPVRLVPFPELVSRWDGNGLVVSAGPIDIGAMFAPAWERLMMYAAVGMVTVLVIYWARRRWLGSAEMSRSRWLSLSVAQAAAFAIVALLCGMIYHFANDEGLLANANATASIQQAHQSNFIPKVSEKKVHKLLDSDTIFIDARFARDFKAGHLRGAINLPVDANDDERQKTSVNIAKDARIVVYCQSAGCKFAEIVAIKLKNEGFSNISVFRGGWQEWVAKNGKKKGKQI